MITFGFLITPVPYDRPRFNAFTKSVFLSKKYRDFKRDFRSLSRNFLPKAPLSGALRLEIQCQVLRPKSVKRAFPSVKPDLDNLAKAIIDAMNPEKKKQGWVGFWQDDGQSTELHAAKSYGSRPFISIQIIPLEEGVSA